ncbi:MAG: hypothetical protein ABEH43_04620, partial [Flavobacteriales bacterium]
AKEDVFGVIYPCVHYPVNALNVAILPEFVDHNMTLELVGEHTIYKKGETVAVDNERYAIPNGQDVFEYQPVPGNQRAYMRRCLEVIGASGIDELRNMGMDD